MLASEVLKIVTLKQKLRLGLMIQVLLWVFLTRVGMAGELDYSGYFRAPIGSNLSGGKEVQISNPGTAGNEFRLGNETPYGELNLTAHMGKALPPEAGHHVLDSKFTFAINPPLDRQYGDTTPTTDYMQLVQAYLVAEWSGPTQYWVGKRFYRWGYVVMDDFFYFADMSGNGMGADHIPVEKGELALALLQFTDSTVSGTNGHPSKDAFDIRWGKLPIDNNNNLDVWGVLATSGPGAGTQTVNGTANAVNYKAGEGMVLALRWNHLLDGGTNELSAQYGSGIMQSLNLNADAIAPTDATNKQNRMRFVENLNTEVNENWSLRSGLIYEVWDTGDANHSKQRWSSVGFRPSYQVDKYLQWLFEAGVSSVTSDKEGAGARTLTRLSTGPQWGIAKGLAANPVIRGYLAYSDWNRNNADATNTNSIVGQYVANNPNSTLLTNVTHIMQAGVELEIGF